MVWLISVLVVLFVAVVSVWTAARRRIARRTGFARTTPTSHSMRDTLERRVRDGKLPF